MARGKTDVLDDDKGLDMTSLGEAAEAALGPIMEGQVGQAALDPALEIKSKVKFVGMAYDAITEDINLHDEMVFVVRARCTATTVEELKDGGTRNVRRMDVLSVMVKE